MGEEEIFVVGVGMTPFGKFPELSVKDLTRMAVTGALEDAGCDRTDLQAAYFAQTTQGYLEGQVFIPGPIALRAMGIHGIPMVTIENACASGSTAFWEAINFVRSGSGDLALAVGAEKMNVADKKKVLGVFDSGWDIYEEGESLRLLAARSEGLEIPENDQNDAPSSVFMDAYAYMSRVHMKKYGLTQRQLAAVSAKNHQHSVHNERAHFRMPFTVDEVLSARALAYPLTVPMCAPVTDGAAAAIICNSEALNRYGLDRSRAIKVLNCTLASGRDDLPEDGPNAIARAARNAYETAGVGPEEMSVAEVHDASAFGEIKQSENLELCPIGEGGVCAERGDTSLGSRIPINPSGGLESKGHPLGATGLGQIFELVGQLRGECGERQVENARFAIQENGGGMIKADEAVFVLSIFAKQ
ncbi:MAG: thiolase family protein [Marinicaulis sp.]|nr:thiolase family protein [Marinicaulis sp.]